MRVIAAATAGLAAAITAAGAALGLRRRKRRTRRAERRQARRPATSTRAVTTTASSRVADEAAAEAIPPAKTGSPAAETGTMSDPTLRSIKGIGDVAERRLAEAGVTSVAQVAAWTGDDIERIAGLLNVNAARIRREDWVGQARSLQPTS